MSKNIGENSEQRDTWITRHGHPMADKRGRILLHRFLASELLERPLLPTEIVHHIDGDHTNNDPDNLTVVAGDAEHRRLHVATRNLKAIPNGGAWIRKLRNAAGVQQQELAAAAKFRGLCNVEMGNKRIMPEDFALLVGALNDRMQYHRDAYSEALRTVIAVMGADEE